MAIHTFLYRALVVLAVLALVAGCANPKSNPYQAPPPLNPGTPLDLNATHITTAGSPYIVNSDWTIEAGRTVTIDPGVTIMFAGAYNITVDGKIDAQGQADQPNNITFTTAFQQADLGQWGNLRLKNQTDPSVFKYCVFSYGAKFNEDTSSETSKFYRGMLSIRNSSPVIENCLVIFNQDNAIYVHADLDSMTRPAPQIRYNVFTKNDGAAFRTQTDVDMNLVVFSHNSVGDNSVIPFLLAHDDSTYGDLCCLNANLDSVDAHGNLLDDSPAYATTAEQLQALRNGSYGLQSCSPAVDGGPEGVNDNDGTRRDLGPAPYHQVANELRGVWTGTLTVDATYRMSCNVRVPVGATLTIPAGVKIETTGLYNLEVFGRLEIQGTEANRVVICNCQVPGADVWGGLFFFNLDTLSAPSVIQYADIENYRQMDVERPGVQFTGVRFTGGFQYGIFVNTHTADLADSVSFRDCEFTNCGSYGVRSDSSAVTVRNSLIHNIKGRGISINAVEAGSIITNTVVQACSTSAVALENLTNTQITNCALIDNGYHGLQLTRNCNPVVMNTIIWYNHHKGVFAVASSNPHLEYNTIASNIEVNLDPLTLQCANCLPDNTNPLFVSETDAHLTSGSPCINAGNPDPQYNDGDGSINDQGAYGGPAGGSVGPAVRMSNRMVVQR